jgi:hypothetical protein
VGTWTWQRVTRCKGLVGALEKAGLEEFVLDNVVGNGDARVTFHVRFSDRGDTIRFYPVLPDCVCFAAQWAVAVAYPGKKWTRP